MALRLTLLGWSAAVHGEGEKPSSSRPARLGHFWPIWPPRRAARIRGTSWPPCCGAIGQIQARASLRQELTASAGR